MIQDVKCPYCNSWQEIDHDDGVGYEENILHNQQCSNCSKYFTFTTSVLFSYESYKADCLNDAEHKYSPINTYPKEFTKMECIDCGDRREPTQEEWKEILK